MNRFKKFGGATPCEIYGYFKPEGAKTFDDWRKDDAATPNIREALRRLKVTLNCSAVADWFNQQGVPVGKYCGRKGRKLKKWNGVMVRRYFRNPLLKGQPGRGFRHTIKHHGTQDAGSSVLPTRRRTDLHVIVRTWPTSILSSSTRSTPCSKPRTTSSTASPSTASIPCGACRVSGPCSRASTRVAGTVVGTMFEAVTAWRRT